MTEEGWLITILENGFIPCDYYHLWNILAKNPSNMVRKNSIKEDLKMIKNILPEEIQKIYNTVCDIINNGLTNGLINDKSYDFFRIYNQDLYKNLAVSYLQHGLAGIEVKEIMYCIHCKKEKENVDQETCMIINKDGHIFEEYKSSLHMFILCGKCGIHRKTDGSMLNTIETFGPCIKEQYKNHSYTKYRYLHCSINDS